MPKLQTLVFFLLSLSPLFAETVLWKATGTLDAGSGVFLRNDLSPGDPLTIRITYNDQATQQLRGEALGQVESDYRTNIDLNITITSGPYTWSATVDSATTSAPTTFRTITKLFPGPETVDLEINSNDNGTFPSFPFRLGESFASISLDFNGANNSFLDSGISAPDIHPEELSTATGTISTGVGNTLPFTIDPSSLEVLFEADEIVPPIAVTPSIAVSNDTVSITWQSDFRFRYQIESTDDLSSETWPPIETRFGTDAILTRTYPRADHPNFFRIVTLPRTPAG